MANPRHIAAVAGILAYVFTSVDFFLKMKVIGIDQCVYFVPVSVYQAGQ